MADHKFVNLKVDEIVPSRWQPRSYPYDGDNFEELKESVRRHGVRNRVRVFVNERDQYETIVGHRRIAAAKEVGRDRVPGEIAECDGEDGLKAIHEEVVTDNLYHEDLTPIEEANAVQGFIEEHGYTQQEAAHVLGKSQQWISDRLSILKLAPAVQTALTARAVEFSTARELSTLPKNIQVPVMKSLETGTSREAAKVAKEISKALEPGFWDLPEEGVLQPAQINVKRLVDCYLSRVPEGKMDEVIVCLRGEGVLDPPHKLTSWELPTFARCCGEDLLEDWEDIAPQQGWICENCMWNEAKPFWPCGQEDGITCHEYFMLEDDPVRLPIPNTEYNEGCEICEDEIGWCTDVGCQLEQIQKREEENELEREIKATDGLRAFYDRQQKDDVDTDHWLAQPCKNCGLFRGPEQRDQCSTEKPQMVRTEFWQGPVIVPRCSGHRVRDLRSLPEVEQGAIADIMISWLRMLSRRQFGPVKWLYDGDREGFARFLKEEDFSTKQLAALMTMLINEGEVPSWRADPDATWGQVDPVTGEQSEWRLLKDEDESEEDE